MFEEFWQLYPRRIGRKDALKAWSKMTDIQQTKALKAILAHIKAWAYKEREYIPYPASWLRGERWEDEIEAPRVIPQLPARPGESMEEWQARCRMTRV